MNYLEDKIIKLRALEPEDLEYLYEWENISNLWITGNTRTPISRFQLKEYIAQQSFNIFDLGYLRLIITLKEDDTPIGTVDLFDFDSFHSRVALGLFVTKEHQGKGYAKRTLKLVEQYVFDFLKLHQLYVDIAESNIGSRQLFEKDYEKNAILKDWLKTNNGYENVICYQKIKKTITQKI